MSDGRTIAFLGNFDPPHSTENHLLIALRDIGCEVIPMQENDPGWWNELLGAPSVDMVLWVRTWHLPAIPQLATLDHLRRIGVPTVGYHLDRWWGLNREHQVHDEPFFRCALVVTADGGHDKQWADAGMNHAWLPPGVLAQECEPGRKQDIGPVDFAFVGSWRSYHDEWPWRKELIRHMRSRYGNRFRCYPKAGGASIRGRELADLYQSVPVLIGDSCLAPNADGQPIQRYWSDRIPETLGRGGILVHPDVDGLHDAFPVDSLWRYERCNPDDLFEVCDMALIASQGAAGDEAREQGRQWVLDHATYQIRCQQLLTLVDAL